MMDVEIWSDIACPWCYIGKRRFEQALGDFPHAEAVNVTWRAFELDPEAPVERGGERAARLAAKYGISVEEAREREAAIVELAAAEGLAYRFDIARSANTFDGHRLIRLAAAHDQQDAMKERLLAAHFCEGELVSDPETLVRLGSEVGLDADEVRATLRSERFAAEVREDEATAGAFGLSGVPSFVVDRQIGVSGAQPPEVLLALLEQGWERRAVTP